MTHTRDDVLETLCYLAFSNHCSEEFKWAYANMIDILNDYLTRVWGVQIENE